MSLTSSLYSRTHAPPPSPKRTAVLRSVQSTQPERRSAPTSRTRRVPVSIRPWAVRTPYMKPLQAALMSMAGQVAPMSAWIMAAVAGAIRSGDVVARMMKSMSAGVRPASAIALRAASAPRERVVPPMRRSRIPVRSEIHSSDVSRVSESSSFVTTRSGRPIPQPVKRTPMCLPLLLAFLS